jgi:hypothetical protein
MKARLLSNVASYNVASNVCWALRDGCAAVPGVPRRAHTARSVHYRRHSRRLRRRALRGARAGPRGMASQSLLLLATSW